MYAITAKGLAIGLMSADLKEEAEVDLTREATDLEGEVGAGADLDLDLTKEGGIEAGA